MQIIPGPHVYSQAYIMLPPPTHTHTHTNEGLKQQEPFHNSGGQTSRVKVAQVESSLRLLSPCLADSRSPCPHKASSLCKHSPGISMCPNASPYKAARLDQGHSSLQLIHLFKGPDYSHVLRQWGQTLTQFRREGT